MSISVVRFFYVSFFFVLIDGATSWNTWLERAALYPLWPIAWIDGDHPRTGIAVILLYGMLATFWAAATPQLRVARIACTIGLVSMSALFNSTTGAVVMHGYHAWIWCSFLFVFLPDGGERELRADRGRALTYVRLVWAAQAAVLLFYTFSGAWKLLGGSIQAVRGELGVFAPGALARQTAARILEGAKMPAFPLGPWLIDHPAAGSLTLPFAIYLETTSFLVAFRPALHRIWGVALIGMHLAIYFTMTILFSWQMLLVGTLLLCSPFVPAQTPTLREIIRQLPIVGDTLRLIRARRASATPACGT